MKLHKSASFSRVAWLTAWRNTLNVSQAQLAEDSGGFERANAGYPWSSFAAYLAATKHRPGWIRVNRLLAEHGIGQDTAEGRQEFERRMEARRLDAAEPESLKALRRGWCLGSAGFRQEAGATG